MIRGSRLGLAWFVGLTVGLAGMPGWLYVHMAVARAEPVVWVWVGMPALVLLIGAPLLGRLADGPSEGLLAGMIAGGVGWWLGIGPGALWAVQDDIWHMVVLRQHDWATGRAALTATVVDGVYVGFVSWGLTVLGGGTMALFGTLGRPTVHARRPASLAWPSLTMLWVASLAGVGVNAVDSISDNLQRPDVIAFVQGGMVLLVGLSTAFAMMQGAALVRSPIPGLRWVGWARVCLSVPVLALWWFIADVAHVPHIGKGLPWVGWLVGGLMGTLAGSPDQRVGSWGEVATECGLALTILLIAYVGAGSTMGHASMVTVLPTVNAVQFGEPPWPDPGEAGWSFFWMNVGVVSEMVSWTWPVLAVVVARWIAQRGGTEPDRLVGAVEPPLRAGPFDPPAA